MSYQVVGLLGRGGMAVVELAVDGYGRQVARKRVVLSGSSQQIELARQRLRREAEILAELRHPGIVPLLAVEDDGTDVVLVMPRMVESLADRIAIRGPLPPREVSAAGRVLLDALATAHRQGVIHRDIKPANVLFDDAGRPALADFGVAVTRQFTAGLTSIGMVMGTPEFIAPEQARGEPATRASDVFSLGATLRYALCGQGPFGEGEPMALLVRAAQGHVSPLPRTIPVDLRRAVAAMLDVRQARRPTAAAALGGPSGTAPHPAPRRRGGKGWILLTLVAVVVLLIAAGVLALRWSSAVPTPTRALSPTAPAPAAAACTPLPYQPCGQPPAPFTDGRVCLAGHADFDGNPDNGCEAVSDYLPGTVLESRRPILANLVPADAVDTFRTNVHDNLFDLCLGQFHVTLTAPPGVTDRVEITRGGEVLARA
ncbi:MAG TPA: serine/threonine-protein kinase, partial [Acidimicrobiales bacterium]|nr:serine/threonine-protein kinase [Acidimicrobiales bacterium]